MSDKINSEDLKLAIDRWIALNERIKAMPLMSQDFIAGQTLLSTSRSILQAKRDRIYDKYRLWEHSDKIRKQS